LELILLCALLAQPASTSAPVEDAALREAKERYARAKELYAENNFRAAVIEFDRAYALTKNFKILYSIAQVEYQSQDYPAAVRHFERYLEQGGDRISAERRDEVVEDVERLRARIARVLIVVQPPGAQVLLDDLPLDPAILAQRIEVGAGRHTLSARAEGYVLQSTVVDLAGLENREVELTLLQNDGGRARLVRLALPWTLTGAAAIATVGLGVAALSASASLRHEKSLFGVTRADLTALANRSTALAVATDVFLAVTTAGAALSLYFTLTQPSASTQVQVGVAANQVSFSGAF
jgi:hypothetical protein